MLFNQIAQNKRRTVYVMVAFLILVIVIGASIGYVFFSSAIAGLLMAMVIGGGYTWMMVAQSTSVVMLMNHAHEVTSSDDAPELFHVVEDMALVAQIPMPKIYIIDDPSPNAFATGNNPEHAAVAATTGLLAIMNREELEGVIGHEVSHIRNYDIRLSTIAMALSAAIALLVNFAAHSFWWGGGRRSNDNDNGGGVIQIVMMVVALLAVILGPIAASMAQMALSRNREYLADASSVELTRNPQGMIDALKALEQAQPMKAADPTSAALYISDPIKKKSMSHLFDTHPPLEDRIARLERM